MTRSVIVGAGIPDGPAPPMSGDEQEIEGGDLPRKLILWLRDHEGESWYTTAQIATSIGIAEGLYVPCRRVEELLRKWRERGVVEGFYAPIRKNGATRRVWRLAP